MFYTKKSELDKLKQKYRRTMRNSFKLALKDRKKSLMVHREACQIQERIKKLEAKG